MRKIWTGAAGLVDMSKEFGQNMALNSPMGTPEMSSLHARQRALDIFQRFDVLSPNGLTRYPGKKAERFCFRSPVLNRIRLRWERAHMPIAPCLCECLPIATQRTGRVGKVQKDLSPPVHTPTRSRAQDGNSSYSPFLSACCPAAAPVPASSL